MLRKHRVYQAPAWKAVVLWCLVVGTCSGGWAQAAVTVRRIPAGTVVRRDAAPTWNRVVLVATPRIASGAVEALDDSIRNAIREMPLVIMACVRKESDAGGRQDEGAFSLVDVGVGYATKIKSRLTVVDSANASKLGASLGFVQRRMLSTNESQLSNVKVVLRSTTLLMFDTPAIFFRGETHVDRIARHLVWVETKTGELSMAVWLVAKNETGNLVATKDPIRVLQAPTQEDRRIHVDGSQFIFGIPRERAFALEALPPGDDRAWNAARKRWLNLNRYDRNSLVELTKAINP
ncbi:MAG: hypothetical protein AAF989_06160 [Planctomycetota bacterium]